MQSVYALKPVKKYDFKPENFGMIYKLQADLYEIYIPYRAEAL